MLGVRFEKTEMDVVVLLLLSMIATTSKSVTAAALVRAAVQRVKPNLKLRECGVGFRLQKIPKVEIRLFA